MNGERGGPPHNPVMPEGGAAAGGHASAASRGRHQSAFLKQRAAQGRSEEKSMAACYVRGQYSGTSRWSMSGTSILKVKPCLP